MPAAANGAAGTDGELVVIDGGVAYNFWQFKRTSATTATTASYAAENVVTGDGWGSKSPFLAAGTTAVGSSLLGGLLVKAETDDGSIDHALQLVVDAKLVMSGFTGNAIAGDGSSPTGIVKEGQLLAIAPGTPMPAGLSKLGQEVFTAMQKYGAYVVDVAGGTTNIRAQANAYDDATMTALWHDMGKITPLLQGVSNSGGGTQPPVTQPPVTQPPVTQPPVTTPPVGSTDTTAPKVQWVAANGSGLKNGSGTVRAGDTVRLSVNFNEVVNVSGTPTLKLNSNGTATYVSGAGTNTLQFDYKVGAGQNAADLAITGYNLGGVKDLAGNAVNVAGAPQQPAGTLAVVTTTPPVTTPPVITPPVTTPPVTTPPVGSTDTTAPKVQWVAANGSGLKNGSGTVRAGDTVRLSVNFNEVVNVSGTPTLKLNSNGTATYVSGAGTNTLQFDYKVGAGQNAADLAITGYNLGGVKDLAGNAVNIAGAPQQPAGTLAVVTTTPPVTTPPVTTPPVGSTDTTAPKVQWVAANGSGLKNGSGVVRAGDTVRLSVNFNETVNVTGTPTLKLNSNGTAKYVSGSGTNTLQFDYKVGAGEKAFDLEISGYNLVGVRDNAGNAVNVAGAPHQPAGTLAVLTTPSVNNLAAASSSPISDIAANPAATSGTGLSANIALPASSPGGTSSPNVWSNFGQFAAGGAGLAFGSQTTLGYSAPSQYAGGNQTAADGSLISKMTLLGQYAASSFATTAPSSTAAPSQDAWGGSPIQTLAKSQG
jgi:hypothetical protein